MSNLNQSTFLSHYKNLLPKSILNENNLSKKTSKRCSSTYRQRLKRIKTNCQLIRQRRRRCLLPIPPIELRPSLFQQRFYQTGSLETLNVSENHWQSTNILRLSDEYLYKCKYAIYSTTNRSFKQNEFYHFLKELFSYPLTPMNSNEDVRHCQMCNQQYTSDEMFDRHLNRRSVSIQYRCLICQTWIRTMNPCQAYSHLLSHRNSMKIKRIEQLNINHDWENTFNFIDDIFAQYSLDT